MRPVLSYIVCSSPRSGSSLLCDALARTGVTGAPDEYGRPSWQDEIINYARLGAHSEREYLKRVIDLSTTPNGVFGTKLHAYYTPFFVEKIAAHLGEKRHSLKTALEAVFPRLHYIYISRDDTVAQAVSYYRALMTNEWWRWGESVPARDAAVPFSQMGIKKCLLLIDASNRYWEGYFAAHDIKPLHVRYDELVENYEGTVRKTLRFLGLPDTGVVPPPKLYKMADDRSTRWAQTFKELEATEPFRFVTPPPSWMPY